MRLLQFFLLTVVVLPAHAAFAARPNYTYLGLGYAYDHLDGGCEQDGVSLEGSLVIDELSYIRLNHIDVTSSSWCGSTTSSVAGGVRSDVGGSSSVYATAAISRRDYGYETDLGLAVDTGFRSMVLPGVEVGAFIGYEIVDSREVTYFGGGVNYWLSRSISVTAAVTVNDNDDEGARVSLRYNF